MESEQPVLALSFFVWRISLRGKGGEMLQVWAPWCASQGPKLPFSCSSLREVRRSGRRRPIFRIGADADSSTAVEDGEESGASNPPPSADSPPPVFPSDKGIKKVVQKAAGTFAPRASTASKNPAVPGSTLYKVFEVQAYVSMFFGGALSFNLLFPSNEPDLWRLMGMWSIWMFTVPSLRARDCSKQEKEALNYLFLLIPLINVTIPFFLKSFAVVWSADTVAFFLMYSWKLGWFQKSE